MSWWVTMVVFFTVYIRMILGRTKPDTIVFCSLQTCIFGECNWIDHIFNIGRQLPYWEASEPFESGYSWPSFIVMICIVLNLRWKLGSLLVLAYTSHCMSMNYEFDKLDANHFLVKKVLATYLILINSDFFLIINQVQNVAAAIYRYLNLNWLC